MNTLFGNIEQIQCVNRELMEQLETMSVGEAFLRLGPFLKLYSMYAKNHEQALATLIVGFSFTLWSFSGVRESPMVYGHFRLFFCSVV